MAEVKFNFEISAYQLSDLLCKEVGEGIEIFDNKRSPEAPISRVVVVCVGEHADEFYDYARTFCETHNMESFPMEVRNES